MKNHSIANTAREQNNEVSGPVRVNTELLAYVGLERICYSWFEIANLSDRGWINR